MPYQHLTGIEKGGWKLLMWLYGGKGEQLIQDTKCQFQCYYVTVLCRLLKSYKVYLFIYLLKQLCST